MSRLRPGKKDCALEISLPADWEQGLADWPRGDLRGVALRQWCAESRRELGLPTDRPLIATGHQTLLWHPGILAKYLLVQSLVGDREAIGAANLIVDQHTERFGDFEIPVRRPDGTLDLETITLTTPKPEVPMGRHPAFAPPSETGAADGALPSVQAGVQKILEAIAAHRDLDSAALQMAAALDDLMSRWVAPLPGVCSSGLMKTSLARALLEEMAADPRLCAACYNTAVEQTPGTGIAKLQITGQRVELPLWKLGPDDRRQRADHEDLQRCLRGDGENLLLPRALFLTLLVRMGMCDLFVHGTGGANYDRATERWLWSWLGLKPCPIAVVTATLRLPFPEGDALASIASALQAAHRAWHDPEGAAADGSPGRTKREMLMVIEAAPRRSAKRTQLFRQMHERLATLRKQHAGAIRAAQQAAEEARRKALEAPIINGRTWPFPLYPDAMIDDLADAVARKV